MYGFRFELFEDLCNGTCTYGVATFTDCELKTFFHCDWVDQFYGHGDVVTRHYHFYAFWQSDGTGYVGGTEVELWTIAIEEWFMTATFFFRQDVYLGFELGVWGDGVWMCQYLTTFDFFLIYTTEQYADVVPCFCMVEDLTEHFYAGADGLLDFWLDTYDLQFVADFQLATFYTTGCYGTTTGDGENVFDWHQEWLIDVTGWGWDVFVDGLHQFFDAFCPWTGWVLQCLISGATDDWDVIAWIFIFAEEFADFHFNEVEEFFVVDEVALVHEYDDVRNAYLTSEQDVFAGLWHWTVSCRYNEDCTVHLSSTGDHVLNIVGVPWAVYVCIVTGVGFIFNVRGVDGNTAFSFFWRLVDIFELGAGCFTFEGKYCGDSCGGGGFTMVNVTDGTDVYVWFSTLESFFCHFRNSSLIVVF